MATKDSLEELFSDADYCRKEMARIRDKVGTKPPEGEDPLKHFDPALSALALMLFNCPEEMKYLVRAQIEETSRRQTMVMMLPLRRLCHA